jgi:trimethylamine--corrinoid protein Co-methyltransferase
VNVILDAELFHVLCDILEGISVTEETLALDAIAELAASGDLSAHPHTERHLAELWRPATFSRETLAAWESAGRPDPRERARAEVRRILAEHEPEPLSEDVDLELVRIIEARTAEGDEHRRTVSDGYIEVSWWWRRSRWPASRSPSAEPVRSTVSTSRLRRATCTASSVRTARARRRRSGSSSA